MSGSSTTAVSTEQRRRREDEITALTRVSTNPGPALRWLTVALVMLALEFGAALAGAAILVDSAWMAVTALVELLVSTVSPEIAVLVVDLQSAVSSTLANVVEFGNSLPTLLGRDLVANEGHLTGPNGPWTGTFLGLEPAVAWAIRLVLILSYSLFAFYWLFKGWLVFREHYRSADWTPRDDIVARLRGHRWAQFGIIVVILYLTMGLFAPAMGPTTVDQNILSPYSHEIQYYDEEAGEVQSILVGDANFNSKSKGAGGENVGPMSYDDFNRFHPFGTLQNGRDLFTFLIAGARNSLVVAGLAIALSALIATIFALVSAFYKGTVDLIVLTMADGLVSIPILLLLILTSTMFGSHWLARILDGGFLIGLVYGLVAWPFLWRAIRGPSFQVSEEGWVDAAKSYGQRPFSIMRRHMLPFVSGYMMVYASLSFGSVIILMAALSFLNIGINPPTPAWGRAIANGQPYVSGPSWHIAAIPGVMIVVIVTGLNALGDGIRDAIDPESEGGDSKEAATGGGA